MSTRSIAAGVLWLAAAGCLLLAVYSARWALHWRWCNGLVLSARDARLRVFAWDTTQYRIDYAPGISADDQAWHAEWLPYTHWGQPPASYAAPGRGEYILAIPLWMIAGACIAAGVIVRRRRPRWQCRCGYDLRGLAAEACPECGRRRSDAAVERRIS